MSIVDRITAHRDRLGLRSIEMPEWGDENGPLVVYWRPMTPREHARVFGSGETTAATYVDLVQLKALDAKGDRLFDGKEGTRKALLDGADITVLGHLANAMLATAFTPAKP